MSREDGEARLEAEALRNNPPWTMESFFKSHEDDFPNGLPVEYSELRGPLPEDPHGHGKTTMKKIRCWRCDATRCWRCDAEAEPQDRDRWSQISLRDALDEGRDWPAVDLCRSCTTAFKRDFLGGWQCPEVLILDGEAYRCDQTCVDADGDPAIGHDGWAHGNKEARAVWGERE